MQPPVDSQGYNTGYDTWANALVTCACGTSSAPGVCYSECSATLCASTPTNPTAACLACVNGPAQEASDGGPGACASAISTACKADTNCVAWESCVGTCPM
jgi:hypothetical protein